MASKVIGLAKQNIDRLKRYQALETGIARLLGGWLPGIARWEVKKQVGYHLWEDMRHSQAIRTRLWELRVANPDRDLDPALAEAVERLALAQHDDELLAGVYLVLQADVLAACKAYVASTYSVYDYPSVIMLGAVIPALEAQIAWAEQTVKTLADSGEKRRRVQRWMQYARDVVASVGGVDGAEPVADFPVPPPGYGLLLPFSEAKRDERFTVAVAGAPMPDEADPVGYMVWQFANYVQEMQAAETLATIMWEVKGMEWDFYFDIARHCWDEIRHSELGENRLNQLGHHIADFPSSIGSYGWRQLFNPLIRYCALTYVIEADSFALKHASYQRYLEQDDMESAQALMYDIMDETMHVRFGQKWVDKLKAHYGETMPLDALIQECRSIVAKHAVAPAQRAAAVARQ